jgi:serine/threonine-protein kinase HipA
MTLFLLTQLAFLLMAATDGHAKNFSIYLDRGDAYRMTPLYDVLSMWPYYGDGASQFRPRKAGLAMAVRSKNAHYLFHTIQARHWKQLAARHGGDEVWAAMVELVSSVEDALARVEQRLPKDFPAHTWEGISTGMRSEAERFLREAGLL